jgi:Ca-activated chloride channel homolog
MRKTLLAAVVAAVSCCVGFARPGAAQTVPPALVVQGKKAMYDHNRTRIGGLVSRDFTDGYGPEEYTVRKAMHGMYKIQANYYGSRAAKLLGPVTVQVDVFTHFGRPDQQRETLTFRLTETKETFTIGEIEF